MSEFVYTIVVMLTIFGCMAFVLLSVVFYAIREALEWWIHRHD